MTSLHHDDEMRRALDRREELFGDWLDRLGDAVPARSGGLRPEPCSTVSALRAPATIAKEANDNE